MISRTRTRKFPNDPILVKLLHSAKLTTENIIHDAYGFDKTYADLLGDVMQMRDAIRANLPPTALNARGILNDDRPYVCVLTRSGYEFLVAFFAIRAIGGACANRYLSIGSGILPEEAEYFISDTKATCLLISSTRTEKAGKISECIKQNGGPEIATLVISNDASPLRDIDIGIDESLEMNPQGPGLVFFTPGTTGHPKGLVLPKQCSAFQQTAEPNSASLSFRPPHWLGGAMSLLTPPLIGMKLYILKERATPESIWKLLRKNRITSASFTPAFLRQLKEVYTDKLSNLPEEEQQKYLDGFNSLVKIRCDGAMVSPTTRTFWTSMTGRPFQNVYASTESGGTVLETNVNEPTDLEHSVGTPALGVDVKLSEGDHGEILVKSPWMLTHYIGNEEATKAAFDEEGYLKTGDLAHLVDGKYVFDGRVAADDVFFHGYRIQSIRVEEALTDLPYVSEACVIGVPEDEAKELCAALIRLKEGTPREEISLARVRADLSETLPAYMRPYLLRIMDDGEKVPCTVSSKPIKKEILKQFFGITEYWSIENPTPGVESWGDQPVQVEAETKPWDWCGLQRSE
ncbi:Acyl-CoA synthetase family member 3, mitochondrial [Tolypocladium ophioglossoides CBS 100239]|uniref:Acyl-CoA synthetase family member 3, mitochondrial n=1 Tax=Tolypocladium ophioglossoides (strain CBS 100239) TaxID=1163406 RepID=A0A0L0N021_TOLOC|nr:Acyl-CoA synthetase family member 3, mitochondrial [Tolypocladium ophioglossoides CBS 100239]